MSRNTLALIYYGALMATVVLFKVSRLEDRVPCDDCLKKKIRKEIDDYISVQPLADTNESVMSHVEESSETERVSE